MQKRINMKNISFLLSLIFLIFTFYSCNKDKDGPFIKAGIKVPLSYYEKFGSNDVQALDVDKDGKDDFLIKTSVGSGMNGYSRGLHLISKDTSVYQVCLNDTMYSANSTYYIKDFKSKEVINKYQNWGSGGALASQYYIPSIWPYTFVEYSHWIANTGFIGIRKRIGNEEYRYGWIRLRVNDYDDVYILEYCLIK